MAGIIIAVILLLPIYGVLIWSYFYPEESMLFFGKRWMYKEEPELSEDAISYTKFVSIIAIFIVTIILVSFIFDNPLVRLLLVLGLVSFIGYKLIKN
ncbi:hypothetical protein [Ammoniphilus sp. YIM 78166]|uniref:hypothetical protein n=1 Tax=Ammoniphilus sp. YIM 78166 TaxID=1644106 RepID=UPI00196B67EF|nr:hypothetical protein [Ammoniphilus sp. YIM 78166]